MDDLLYMLTTAGIIFCLIGLASAVWWLTKTVNLVLASQTQLLRHQVLLDQAIMQMQDGAQMVPLPNWRDLPPDARLVMRNSLIDVLREMDAEMPRRH